MITQRDLLVPTLLDDPGVLGPGSGGRRNRLDGLRVSDLMSDESVTAEPDRPLVRAVQTMIDQGVNRLPVVDNTGRPLGILTRDDVLRAVASCRLTATAGRWRGRRTMTRIGMLTGGGDVPGLNPCIKTLVDARRGPRLRGRRASAGAGPGCSHYNLDDDEPQRRLRRSR